MVGRQHFHMDDNGDWGIRNEVDFSNALEETRRMNETREWKGENGYILGNIPEELWLYDPWLIEAAKARRERDYGKYTDYILRFFRVHSALACRHETVNWAGWDAPILDGKERAKRPDIVENFIRGTA